MYCFLNLLLFINVLFSNVFNTCSMYNSLLYHSLLITEFKSLFILSRDVKNHPHSQKSAKIEKNSKYQPPPPLPHCMAN